MIPMQLIALIPLIFYVLLIGLHIALAVSIHKDAAIRERDGGRLMFIAPRAWCIAALVCGIIGLLVYWLMHYSTLAATDIEN